MKNIYVVITERKIFVENHIHSMVDSHRVCATMKRAEEYIKHMCALDNAKIDKKYNYKSDILKSYQTKVFESNGEQTLLTFNIWKEEIAE